MQLPTGSATLTSTGCMEDFGASPAPEHAVKAPAKELAARSGYQQRVAHMKRRPNRPLEERLLRHLPDKRATPIDIRCRLTVRPFRHSA
jgi:hypothetical protein